MIMNIFTVYDSKADVYGRPFYAHNRAIALRSFAEQVNASQEGNDLAKYPEDFSLYFLGEFDDNSGKFNLSQNPDLVALASDLVRSVG